jgi:aryl-alcohol dehydrogenase-like predicted oxidoreductase
MSVLAGGYLRLNEAYEYILSQPKIKNVVIGISSIAHAKSTLQLLLNKESEEISK